MNTGFYTVLADGSLEVWDITEEREIGGRKPDAVIPKDEVEEFLESYGMPVLNPKPGETGEIEDYE